MELKDKLNELSLNEEERKLTMVIINPLMKSPQALKDLVVEAENSSYGGTKTIELLELFQERGIVYFDPNDFKYHLSNTKYKN